MKNTDFSKVLLAAMFTVGSFTFSFAQVGKPGGDKILSNSNEEKKPVVVTLSNMMTSTGGNLPGNEYPVIQETKTTVKLRAVSQTKKRAARTN